MVRATGPRMTTPLPTPDASPSDETAPDPSVGSTRAPDAVSGASGATKAPRRGGLGEFFLRREALAEAQSREVPAGTPLHVLVRRTRATAEAAVALAAGRPSLRHSDGTGAALLLVRDTVRLALIAHLIDAGAEGVSAEDDTDAPTLWARARDLGLPALATVPPEVLAAVGGWLSSPGVRDDELAVQHQRLRDARVVMDALVGPLEARLTAVQSVRVTRVVRIVTALALAIGLVGGGVFAVTRIARGPNLALRKPVTMSSSAEGYSPQQATDGITDVLGVHSNNDNRPWLQVDLGSPTTIRTIVVHNRSDFGEDRGVPMVIEVSADGKAYTQVARRDAEFHIWTAKIAPTSARYVRLRVEKTTFLHINEVQVFGRLVRPAPSGGARPRRERAPEEPAPQPPVLATIAVRGPPGRALTA